MAFRKLVTALRLLKPGGAALSSVAWWRTDDGPWQEVPLGTSGRSRGGPYLLEPSERGGAGRAVRACAQPPGAGRRAAMGADALRARLRAARGARRAVRPSARDAGAAGPRRPVARGPCSSPRGALRGAGPSPRCRELRRAGVQAGAAGDARQRRRRLPRVDRRRVARRGGARAGGEPAGAAPRPRLRAPWTGPGRHRRGAAGAAARDRAGAGRPCAGASAGSRLRGAPERARHGAGDARARRPRRPRRSAACSSRTARSSREATSATGPATTTPPTTRRPS